MTATQQKHVYLKDLHFEHIIWLNELSFAKDELLVFGNRLSEVELKNNGELFKIDIESLQNRLIVQKQVVDNLRHEIKAQESTLSQYAIGHPIAIDHVHFEDHKGLRDKMTRFSSLYKAFKGEFMRFIAKWM